MSAGHHHHASHAPALTRNQALVLGALEKSGGPLSAYSLLDLLRGEGLRAPLQIYRALEKLIDLGIVHRLESLNAFVCCRQPQCEMHAMTAFAICEKCGKVAEFASDGMEAVIGRWAAATHFRLEKTTIELRGLCAACASA